MPWRPGWRQQSTFTSKDAYLSQISNWWMSIMTSHDTASHQIFINASHLVWNGGSQSTRNSSAHQPFHIHSSTDKRIIWVFIFLIPFKNICCGYSERQILSVYSRICFCGEIRGLLKMMKTDIIIPPQTVFVVGGGWYTVFTLSISPSVIPLCLDFWMGVILKKHQYLLEASPWCTSNEYHKKCLLRLS